ncbi:MAG: threonine/serine exporter family protein [Micropruina sp.]|uniref:threonine/serine ThrE exporter family protein n=1 Tax=Micropruina sp. TaxID=2737536 RepID=UPI0039E34676
MTADPHAREASAVLAEKSDAVCRMGALMLGAGTGSFRVKAAMGRVAAALGIDQLEAQVSLTEVVATTRADGTFRTQVTEIGPPVVNADRIRALLRISLRARPGLEAADLQRQLDRVVARPPLFPPLAVVAGAAAACAAFAFLNNGRWPEVLAAGIAAALGKGTQLAVHRRFRLNQLAVIALAAAVASLAYLLGAGLLQLVPWVPGGPLHEAAFTSAVLFLVPGFPLLTAALDLARFDFGAGISRLLYATMITLAAALGAWVVASVFGLTPAEIPPLGLPPAVLLGCRLLASFVGVFGFAVTFNTPPKIAAAAAAIGTLANVPRLFALDAGANVLLCATAGTLAVGLLAAWISQHLASPRIILSVPAVLIMIPGASTYRALVAMINGDPIGALANGSTGLGVLLGLATGLVIARMLTDPAWISPTPQWTRMPHTHAQDVLAARERRAAE